MGRSRGGYPSGHRAKRGRDRYTPALYMVARARLVGTAQRAEEAHARGIIGSVTCEGYVPSWCIVWMAGSSSVSVASAPPVLGLRSKRGKLLLEISRRMR